MIIMDAALTIDAELDELERTLGVRVLYAAESGSRAWGFASPDSDYDARFIYARPVADYLKLEDTRDTIEWKLDEVLDISGWDLAKFMRLMRRSNPSVFEWLASPVIYRERLSFEQVRGLAPQCFSVVSISHHYLHMARNNAHEFLAGEKVSLKKYLYVVRALLAARWSIRRQSPAPMLFSELMAAELEPEMHPLLTLMLEEKQRAGEKTPHARIPELDAWIANAFTEVESAVQELHRAAKPSWGVLDAAFMKVLEDEGLMG